MINTAHPSGAARQQPGSGQIRSVQALRAIAALFVVAFHSTVLWHDRLSPNVVPWENGNSGVDLFFVISGFIMTLSSRRLAGQVHGWCRFLLLRLIRIAPMYWLVTIAKLAAIVVVPAFAIHTHPTDWNVISSFLFIPARDAVGVIRPVLDVGWTLSFEMLFYLVFASALLFRIGPVWVVVPVMTLLAVLPMTGMIGTSAIASLASPIVLEFAFGVIIGQAFVQGSLSRWSSPWAIALGTAGLLCLAFLPADGIWHRTGIWGVAAAASLAGGVLAERWIDPKLPRFLEKIGEASYSLYLTHGFVLPIVGALVAKTRLTGDALGLVLIVSCVIISTAAALLVYRYVETPVTAYLRGLAGDTRRQATLARSQSAI